MDSQYRCPTCGSTEFITPLNSYDTYQFVDGKLSFIRSEIANIPFELFCRECGRKLEQPNADSS